MAYRWNLLPAIAADLEIAQVDRALHDLDDLLAEIVTDCANDLAVFILRCAQCLSTCMRGARRGGADCAVLYAEHLVVLKKLSQACDRSAVRRVMRAYLRRLGDQVQPHKRSPLEQVIAAIRRDVSEHPERPRSLASYADEYELSVSHLSRAFTRIAGRPFREEVAQIRDAVAQELLTNRDLPIAAIAQRIGLLSASQFSADFKARHGMTPAAFRQHRFS